VSESRYNKTSILKPLDEHKLRPLDTETSSLWKPAAFGCKQLISM